MHKLASDHSLHMNAVLYDKDPTVLKEYQGQEQYFERNQETPARTRSLYSISINHETDFSDLLLKQT